MHQFISFIRYFLLCVNEHSLHSPFVYDIYTKVIKPSKKSRGYRNIEAERKKLLRNKTSIQLTDMGTGGKQSRRIGEIASKSLTKPWKSVLIKNLGEYIEARNVLELGTSLGINTLYMSYIPLSQVHTFEGDPRLADKARNIYTQFGRKNISLMEGNIDKTLPDFLANSAKPDLVYFDANHAYKPTMEYFRYCAHRKKDSSVFIFDDIYYSKEMTRAWREIISDIEVTLSLDLFHVGIVFFDPSLNKKHFILE